MERPGFEEIYTKFEKLVYNYVLRMVKDSQLAGDLSQDIFIKIYENLESYRGEAKLSTWIYKIATNAYLDYFRTPAHKKEKVTELLDDNLDENKKLEDAKRILALDEQMVKQEMNECILEFLDTLPEDYRAVIVLHDLQGIKNREIAEILNCSLDTVKIRLHRARTRFRAVLVSHCSFYRDPNAVLSCDRKERKQDEM